MKRSIIIIVAVIGLLFLYTSTHKEKEIVDSTSTLEETQSPNDPFTVGERSRYVIAWQGIPVGQATATVESLINFKDYEVYKIVVHAETNNFLSMLFRINDTFVSYMDRKKLISRHYEATIREGDYKKDLVVDYDFKNLTATYKNLQDGSVKTCSIEKDVQDPVSTAYYLRTMPIEEGSKIELVVNHSEKNYEISGEVEKKTEFDTKKIGTFEAFLIKPYLKTGEEKLKRTATWGYLSADERRLILYVNIKAIEIPWLGEVTATLESIEYIPPTEN